MTIDDEEFNDPPALLRLSVPIEVEKLVSSSPPMSLRKLISTLYSQPAPSLKMNVFDIFDVKTEANASPSLLSPLAQASLLSNNEFEQTLEKAEREQMLKKDEGDDAQFLVDRVADRKKLQRLHADLSGVDAAAWVYSHSLMTGESALLPLPFEGDHYHLNAKYCLDEKNKVSLEEGGDVGPNNLFFVGDDLSDLTQSDDSLCFSTTSEDALCDDNSTVYFRRNNSYER